MSIELDAAVRQPAFVDHRAPADDIALSSKLPTSPIGFLDLGKPTDVLERGLPRLLLIHAASLQFRGGEGEMRGSIRARQLRPVWCAHQRIELNAHPAYSKEPSVQERPVTHDMTTTAFTLDGYRILESKGVVRGVIVRSRSVIGTIGAGLQTLVGGNISLFTELCERTREDAFQLMLEHARQHGGNAVIGIRYDATEVMGGVTEVLCYGTAVVVTPL